MTAENISLWFRGLSILFIILLGFTVYYSFRKKGSKKTARWFGLFTFLVFIGIVSIVFYNANTDYYVNALKQNPDDSKIAGEAAKNIPKNPIYKDIALLIGIGVRVALVTIITFMLVYLWRRSKTYPKNIGITIHQLCIAIGFVLIVYFVYYESSKCIQSASYREIIPLGLYSAFFAGGMFWMLVCSIIAAAALPEDYKAETKKR